MFMFDFLAEGKRQILINHPSLGKILSSPETIDQFCANLHAFERDLCSPEREERIRFTDSEIERIEKYARSVFSDELKDLSHRIFSEAGFEVYHHAAWRQDLNDWVDIESCYVRAVHRLHGYTLHQKMLEANNPVAFAPDPCVPLRLL